MKSTIEEKETKTRAGRRAVTLDPLAMRALWNRHKKAEDSNLGPDLVEYVWCDSKGGMPRGSNFKKSTWYPIREACQLNCTVHDLRHTQASLMLACGVDFKVIQERLGHAKASTTMDMYAHLLLGAQRKASDMLSG